MTIAARHYNHDADYERVGRFLVRTYRTTGPHINWLQPRWEYMHYHPLIHDVDLNSIGVWEADGEIVGVVHPEHGPGTAYLQIDPAWGGLKQEMLAFAEEHISVPEQGGRRLRVSVGDEDRDLQQIAAEMGYAKSEAGEPMSALPTAGLSTPPPLPPGFRLKSLADDNDLRKLDRVLWRGFNHDGEPPADSVEDRRFMQSAPNFRKELNVVVEALDGNFASYCGMWLEPEHAVAYVEPVATDPAYRRMGLGRAAVLEGVRRCGALGASVAYVGSTMPFYRSLGFERVYGSTAWRREWVTDCVA